MASFKDAAGNTWAMSVTVGSVRRCRNEADVDLLDGGQCLIDLGGDPIKMAAALWSLAEPRPEDPEAFYAALDGPAIKAGMDALVEGLMAFYEASRPKMAAALSALMEAWATAEKKQAVLVAEELRGEPIRQAMEDDMQKARVELRRALASGNSSTG